MPDDEALLEALIAFCAPKSDARLTTARLMQQRGSLGPTLESEARDLSRVYGMCETAAHALTLIPQLSRYVATERADRMERIDTFARAGEYLKTRYIGVHNECFFLLCLDAEGAVLGCPLIQQGTVDEAPFYLRRILELAVHTGTHAVVLSHNHPGGTPRHSPSDVRCTHEAIRALMPMGVLVLDHVLIADGTPVSLYGSADFPDVLFTRQRPDDHLLRSWRRKEE